MEIEAPNAEFQWDGTDTSQQNEHSSSGEHTKSQDKLPEEIVLRADYSCYCTVCDCSLSRIKDAIQHASGKRHKKACKTSNETVNSSTKRQAAEELHNDVKKVKAEETKEEEEARKALEKVFDETFHGGVVALRDNYYCKVCRCMIGNNRKNVNQHKEGKSHKMALEKFKESLLSGTIGNDVPVEDPSQPFEGDGYIEKSRNAKKKISYYCRLCHFRTKERDVITQHINEEKHQLNVRIEEEKEMMAQQRGYQRLQGDYYGEGAEGEMYPEEYYRETGMERFEPWNAHHDDSYYDRQQPPHYGRPFEGEPSNRWEPPFHNRWNQPTPNRQQSQFQNRQGAPFHGDYQDDLNHNTWNSHSETMLQPENHESTFVNEPMNHGHLMMSQARSDPINSLTPEPWPAQVPSMQRDPMAQLQQTPVPFIPQTHPAALPQAPVSSLPFNEQNQMTNTSGGLPGFITNESDAEIVIDVISSLLETYLKYRLQALPGSFMKLLRKSSKSEESVTRINKLSTGKTAKQIFINVQNHKNKAQAVSTPGDESSSHSVLYERRLPKTAENDARYQPHGLSRTENERSDSYDQRSYIEDQLRKAGAGRSLIEKQCEDNSLGKTRETGSSIDDVFHKYRGSSMQGKALENTIKKKPYVTDFSKRYASSSNEDNENTTNDLFAQYRRSNKEDNSSQSIMRNKPSSIDFSNRYRDPGVDASSRGVSQSTQSVVDLFRKYRSPSTYSHN